MCALGKYLKGIALRKKPVLHCNLEVFYQEQGRPLDLTAQEKMLNSPPMLVAWLLAPARSPDPFQFHGNCVFSSIIHRG